MRFEQDRTYRQTITPISIAIADLRHPEITQFLKQSYALIQQLFASDENRFLIIEEFQSPDIRFFAARQQGRYIGCGALAIRSDYGEIKSMFTDLKVRRTGVATAILDRLEIQARQLELPNLMKPAICFRVPSAFIHKRDSRFAGHLRITKDKAA